MHWTWTKNGWEGGWNWRNSPARQYGEYVPPLCQTLVDAQAPEDYATYIVTLGGNKSLEGDPSPPVTQILTHAQDLRIKPKEKVTITTMVWHQHHHLTLVFVNDLLPTTQLINLFSTWNTCSRRKEDLKFPKGNVKRKAYHTNTFKGNQINICLQVLYLN